MFRKFFAIVKMAAFKASTFTVSLLFFAVLVVGIAIGFSSHH